MPKSRQTCTRCSMRRQKCDRKLPCTRCVRDGEGTSCSRQWPGGYNPKIHRTYLKSRSRDSQTNTPVRPTDPENTAIPANSSRDPSPTYAATASHENSDARQGSGAAYAPHNQLRTYTEVIHERNPLRPLFASSPQSPSPRDLRFSTNRTPSAGANVLSPNYPRTELSSDQQQKSNNEYRGEAASNMLEKDYLQSLIPTETQIYQLVEYHESNLHWNYGCINGPRFREELKSALRASPGALIKFHDLRWCALLFAVMATTLTCAPEPRVRSWGFTKPQRRSLSKEWYKGAISCLNMADYMSRIHVYSVQTILVLSLCAHAIGFSGEQFIYFGTALKIAQSLNLQRLSEDPELDDFGTRDAQLTKDHRDRLADRELGRRLWSQLCISDWFSIPSSGMCCINKRHFSTCLPHRVMDDTMCWADESTPLMIDFRNHLNKVARLMADFHDDSAQLPDYSAEKFEMIIQYDLKLRAMDPDPLPQTRTRGQEPSWMRWARGVSVILQAHKLIMMHRSFLGKSFTDPRFVYSRWASLAASKVILQQVEIGMADAERPWLWIDQAHLVSAGMTLCLDIVHRSETDSEFNENLRLVDRIIALLGRFGDSTLALRGVKILSSLLKEGTSNRKAPAVETVMEPQPDGSNSWPLEGHQTYGRAGPNQEPNGGANNLPSTTGVVQSGNSEHAQFVGNSTTTPANNAGMAATPQYLGNDFNSMDISRDVGMIVGSGGIVDTPWDNLFSDFFSAQFGFDEVLGMQ